MFDVAVGCRWNFPVSICYTGTTWPHRGAIKLVEQARGVLSRECVGESRPC